jgi:hypothetical protein
LAEDLQPQNAQFLPILILQPSPDPKVSTPIMAEDTSAFKRLAGKLAVESEPGLTNAQMMVRDLA